MNQGHGNGITIARQKSHRCHADDCKAEIPRHQPFCEAHAAMLSVPMQQRLWRAYQANADHSVGYYRAIDDACDVIRATERRERGK